MEKEIAISIFAIAFMIATGFVGTGNKKQQPTMITITLPANEMDVVLEGLSELPLKKSATIYQKVFSQYNAQLQPKPPAPPEVKKDTTVNKKKN